jgi:hypothetical protein
MAAKENKAAIMAKMAKAMAHQWHGENNISSVTAIMALA